MTTLGYAIVTADSEQELIEKATDLMVSGYSLVFTA